MCIAVLRCAAPPCAAVRCASLRCAALRYAALRFPAVPCSSVRCAALWDASRPLSLCLLLLRALSFFSFTAAQPCWLSQGLVMLLLCFASTLCLMSARAVRAWGMLIFKELL